VCTSEHRGGRIAHLQPHGQGVRRGKMLLSHRTSSSSAAALRGGSSSSRVRPVGPAANRSSARQQQRRLVASRAAEGEEQQPAAEAPEAGGDEAPEQPAIAADDFEFNYSDAKKVRGRGWGPAGCAIGPPPCTVWRSPHTPRGAPLACVVCVEQPAVVWWCCALAAVLWEGRVVWCVAWGRARAAAASPRQSRQQRRRPPCSSSHSCAWCVCALRAVHAEPQQQRGVMRLGVACRRRTARQRLPLLRCSAHHNTTHHAHTRAPRADTPTRRQGNQWQRSDVDAALSYYADEKFLGGGGSEMPYESEFVTNPLSAYANGPEDSRCAPVRGAAARVVLRAWRRRCCCGWRAGRAGFLRCGHLVLAGAAAAARALVCGVSPAQLAARRHTSAH
jgi:hypothetical protein